MAATRIGFIGFGEVGSTFAREMAAHGGEVYWYDVVPKGDTGAVTFLPLRELVERCELILSTVGTHVAAEVAAAAAPLLPAGRIYADMNSTSAAAKRRIADIIASSRADFVEGAILSAVGEAGARAAILVAGAKGEAFARTMQRLGLVNLRYFSAKIGDASQVKMLRSVFSKGVECLLLEMLVAARRAGVAEHLWTDIVDFMTTHAFRGVAENWIKTHPGACERRYHEMLQVVETLHDLRVEPTMTRGTVEFFKRSTASGVAGRFPEKPEQFWDVPAALEQTGQ
jgi:3-hydroxyisobutyrate dehydrogenase-like beta-hydroxyacid dehydrogenase